MRDSILKRVLIVGGNVIVAAVVQPILVMLFILLFLVKCLFTRHFSIEEFKRLCNDMWDGALTAARQNEAYLMDGDINHFYESTDNE